MKTTVGDLMTRDVVHVHPSTPFREIAEKITTLHISAVPVVDAEGLVVGVVSEADLLLKELPATAPRVLEPGPRRLERAKAAALVAGDLMTFPAITVLASATVSDAARLMHDRMVKRLPVVDPDGRLTGIVTRGDLLRVFGRDGQEIRIEILDEIVTQKLFMEADRLEVSVEGGVVRLSGMVSRSSEVDILVRLVRGVDGVVGVDCDLAYEFDDLPVLTSRWRAVV